MKKLRSSAFAIFAFLLSCTVSAQVSNGASPMVPNAAVPTGVVQNNPAALVDPTVSNDATQGYSIGSNWQNSTTGRMFVARGVAAGAAVWTNIEFSDHPGYLAGNWYLPVGPAITSGGSAPGSGSIRLYPGYVKERVSISALGVRVSTLSVGGNVQAAIYANNATTQRPTGNALASTASLSTTNSASVNAAVSIQIEPGLYWFATNCDNGTAAFTSFSSGVTSVSAIIGSTTQSTNLANGNAMVGLSVAQAFGTWPDLTAGSFTEVVGVTSVPLVQFKISSVP
jgi:hypothetical protein